MWSFYLRGMTLGTSTLKLGVARNNSDTRFLLLNAGN